MQSLKEPITNRYGRKILISVTPPAFVSTNNLVFIQHGYSGSMDEMHIQAIAKTYHNNNYTVVLMDCTNSFNDADGTVEENTAQSHYEDLEDVINWASTQNWYQEPFALAGHSLGGLSVTIYSQNFPNKVLNLFPAATVISGKLLEKRKQECDPEEYKQLINGKKIPLKCTYKDNTHGYRSYEWYESMKDWNALSNAHRLHMPTLFIVGSNDKGTPPEHQKLLKNSVTGKTTFYIIKNTDHCYTDKVTELCQRLDSWLKT